MALVVSGVEVGAVPARREGDLCANGVATNNRKTVGLLICWSNTVMVDGSLRDIGAVESSEILISRNHSQTCRRCSCEVCLDAWAASTARLVIASTVLVVDSL